MTTYTITKPEFDAMIACMVLGYEALYVQAHEYYKNVNNYDQYQQDVYNANLAALHDIIEAFREREPDPEPPPG